MLGMAEKRVRMTKSEPQRLKPNLLRRLAARLKVVPFPQLSLPETQPFRLNPPETHSDQNTFLPKLNPPETSSGLVLS
jgi:hypothetical protein